MSTTRRERDARTLRALCTKLYDSATPAQERADLSLLVSCLRARLGGLDIDKLTRASAEEEQS
jgi:hypothetical protein